MMVARTLFDAVLGAWEKTIKPDYQNSNSNYPDEDDCRQYLIRIDYCMTLVNQALTLFKDDPEESIKWYEALITFQKASISACFYVWKYYFFSSDRERRQSEIRSFRSSGLIVDTYNNRIGASENFLKGESVNKRNQKISEYEAKIKELKDSIAQKRHADYWAKHAEKKEQLEQEREQLNEKIKQHQAEIKAIPGNEEIAKLRKQRDELEMDRKALGLFKLAEKKELKIRIVALDKEIQAIEQRMADEKAKIDAVIAPLNTRIQEINEELTKPR